MKLLKTLARFLTRRNVDMAEAAARGLGKGKVADAIDKAQDVVDVVKGKR
ncbi:hypothetical protein UFOVP319_25 [uncultured Caudovirales phage]|uniref:Uncharacterized protein n=1 Tax=uncultured Caudovirales phage TaxID=2100421 RepID=A0A6J5LX29_9CAUD|nr:hypothetical protein UFOVP319_25 [uncultured Caudovirales phage]